MKVPVNRIVPFSAVDGPGNRTAVFTQGCTFTCKYCHNPETMALCDACGICVSVCPAGALAMVNGQVVYDRSKCVMCDACIHACPSNACPRIRWMDADDVMREVRRNMPFIRGVTMSGGECTLYRDFLLEMAERAHQAGLTILLDSNGGYDFSADEALTDAADGVMLDIKAWNDEQHADITGRTAEITRRNLEWLGKKDKLTEVRTVVVPELIDAEETVREVSRRMADMGRQDVLYKIIRFRPMGVQEKYKGLRSPSDKELEQLTALAKQCGMRSVIQV